MGVMELFNACDYLVGRRVRAGDGERVAVRVRGRSLTYEELLEHVSRAAAGFRDLGVGPEDRVLLVLLDGSEFVIAFLAALRLGAIPLPLNPLLPGRDLALAARDARVRVAVMSAERASVATDLLGAPELDTLVLAGEDVPFEPTSIRILRWDELLTRTDELVAYDTWEDSPAFWLCTSGTTGTPKLAMHRHIDLRLTAEGYAQEVLALTSADRCLSIAPMFHAYGLGNSLTFPLSVGATAVLEPTRPPTPALVAELTRSEQPTLLFCVPTFYAALLAADLPPDSFASVRLAVSAGEPLPAELYTRFRDRFGVEILDGIGSTELTHIYVSNRPGQVRPGTSGTPVGGYRVRLEDDDGLEVGPGEPGQLLVAGDSMATGYWCRTDATRERFCGEWFRSGDVYTRSADGFYSYLGRADDMLKVSGEWVSPAEVEAVLIEHPGVLEAAVVGVSDADGLIKPVAFVVPVADAEIEADEILEFCRPRLAGFKRPRRAVVVDALPKTVTGKIQRAKVRELATEPQALVE
jgi:benzoate-CoA ligase family protein